MRIIKFGWVQRRTDIKIALFEFTWHSYACKQHSSDQQWQSIDIVFQLKRGGGPWPIDLSETKLMFTSQETDTPSGFWPPSSATFDFLVKCLRQSTDSGACLAKLIVPMTIGQIVRSNIVPIRLVDCELVEFTAAFAEPLQEYTGRPQLDSLQEIFIASAAGLIIQNVSSVGSDVDIRILSPLVEAELQNRLSFPWISNTPISRKRLVIVEGGFNHPDCGGTGTNIYLGAKALGIDMVVLDNAGHWLEGPEFEDWREAFIPTNLDNSSGDELTDRIVASVQLYGRSYGRKLDGIISFCDSIQVYVARAAQKLGLNTCGPEAYEIATDKYKTSIFEGRDAYCMSTAGEALEIASKNSSIYPAIVKPRSGWASEGVCRVDNVSDLLGALKRLRFLSESRHGSDLVIEKYCSGPEVDANFVVLDGEILFAEVNDDIPKTADINGISQLGSTDNFHELDAIYPSKLPECELMLLQACFHNSLLRLGLRNGVMHMEGRMKNSSFEYRAKSGLLDLGPRESLAESPATPWLIEINPRPPGNKAAEATESTYGVDYWGLSLLIGVLDKPRTKALSQPFRHGPQYTCLLVMIQPQYDASSCEGIFDSDDICVDLINRRPDLARQISRCCCYVNRGQKVPHPTSGTHKFLASFVVFSRQGRAQALQLAKEVRKEVRYSFR
jgi:hypothetical protein